MTQTTPFKDYYVYIHFDPDTEEILYVGMGKGSRAYATKTVKVSRTYYGHRSPEHSEHLDQLLAKGYLPHEWINFDQRGLDKEVAKRLEKQHIENLKPKYNRKAGIKSLKFNKDQIYELQKLRETGLSYKRVAEAMDCSTMAAHRILNNKSPRYREMLSE